MARLLLQTPPAPDAAKGSGPRCCHPPQPPKPPDPPARSPFSPSEGERVELGGPICPPHIPRWGGLTVLTPCRFRVSRIPEQKPGVGGDPLPTSTRPSWLKSTDSRPEVRDWGRDVGNGDNPGVRVMGSRWGAMRGHLLGSFLGKSVRCCWDWEVLTLKPNEGTDGECSATEGVRIALHPWDSSSCPGALHHCENINLY